MKQLVAYQSLLLVAALFLGSAGWSNDTPAAGDAEAGAGKAVFCAYCHGIDGNPPDDRTPRLAGQDVKTLMAKMKRDRPYQNMNHPMLQAFVAGGCLKDRDMRNLAAFYSRQPVRQTPRPASGSPDAR
jgi:cytochrome c553